MPYSTELQRDVDARLLGALRDALDPECTWQNIYNLSAMLGTKASILVSACLELETMGVHVAPWSHYLSLKHATRPWIVLHGRSIDDVVEPQATSSPMTVAQQGELPDVASHPVVTAWKSVMSAARKQYSFQHGNIGMLARSVRETIIMSLAAEWHKLQITGMPMPSYTLLCRELGVGDSKFQDLYSRTYHMSPAGRSEFRYTDENEHALVRELRLKGQWWNTPEAPVCFGKLARWFETDDFKRNSTKRAVAWRLGLNENLLAGSRIDAYKGVQP